MPRPTSIPKPYEKSGQLVVCWRDSRTGHRRTVYLGVAGTTEPRREYARVLTEWEAGDRVVAPAKSAIRRRVRRPDAVTVAEIVLGYFQTVKVRHRKPDGSQTNHGQTIRAALRCLRENAGDHAAIDFGPKALRGVHDSMAASGRFNRDMVNRNTRYITVAFRWAVAEELIPARVHEALCCLDTLKRSEVADLRESKVVHAVAVEVVNATLPYLPTPLQAMVELMRLTGALRGTGPATPHRYRHHRQGLAR